MTDAEQIFWILAALYLFASSLWVRPGAVVLASAIGRRHRLRDSSRAILQNDVGRLLFGNALPCGTVALAQAWPVSLSPVGIDSGVAAPPVLQAPDREGPAVAFSDLKTVGSDGATVVVNGRPFVKLSSANYAATVARLIRKLAGLPPGERVAAIEAAIARSLDAAEAADRAWAARKETRRLRWLGMLLFAFTFGSLGTVAFAGRQLPLWPCLGIYFGLIALIAFEHVLSHRKLRPAEVAERRKYTLISLVSPADAMQAGARLFRLHLEMYHPLTLAAVLGRPDEFQKCARRVLRGLRYRSAPRPPRSSGDPAGVVAWFGERLSTAVDGFLRGRGVDVDRLLAAPTPESPACRGFCPRCEGQYERGTGGCPACGIPLRPFGEPFAPSTFDDNPPPEHFGPVRTSAGRA